jgi:DNA modification methylase
VIRLLQGDCRDVLANLPENHFHTCVTSPPYFGLRDYGAEGQIGLEATPDEFVSQMVAVFREVRRVLRDDGTLWLNLGDSYSAQPGQRKATDKPGAKQATSVGSIGAPSRSVEGLKPKDLIGIPWRVAFALQADGWFLRQDIIWSKPNPMPESVQDRCTKAHEYVFLLSKSARYYYDAEAIAEPRVQHEDANGFRGGAYTNGETNNAVMGRRKTPGNKTHKGATAYIGGDRKHRTKAGLVAYAERERAADPNDLGVRNKRSVWTVATQPFKEAHFATYPPDLIEPCILAGCPKGGAVLDPFGGAGTTGLVADRLGRDCTLIELNPEYAAIARRRIEADAGMFAEVA